MTNKPSCRFEKITNMSMKFRQPSGSPTSETLMLTYFLYFSPFPLNPFKYK